MKGRLIGYSHSIRGRLITGVVVLHAVMMGLVVFDMFWRQQDFMRNLLADKGQAMAEALALNATAWLLSNDLSGLDELTASVGREQDLAYAVILDINGRVRASSDPALFNLTLNDADSVALYRDLDQGSGRRSTRRTHHGLADCLSVVAVGDRRIGYARVALSAAMVESELATMLLHGAEYAVAAILSGGLLAWVLVSSMTRRLEQLSLAADAIAAGDHSAVLPPETGKDEVARLTRDFNAMVRALERDRSKLDRANAELTRLAEVSAHHLQEPVRRLVLFSQRLRSQLTPAAGEHAERSLEQIERDGRYLRDLMRDIQAYLAAGHPTAPPGPVNVSVAARAACRRLQPSIVAQRAEVIVEEMPAVLIDQPRLVDLLEHLIGNALKFHDPAKPPRVTILAERDGGVVRIRVVDNGIGIAETYRERVFHIFERLHPPATSPGTGVGLAIARRIVESCNGQIWLEAGEEAGTVVVVEFPAAEAPHSATSATPSLPR